MKQFLGSRLIRGFGRPAFQVICAATFLFGCSDLLPDMGGQGGGAETDSSGFAFEADEGTCDGWKVRYCEAFVQCGHGTLDECVHEAEYVDCHPDSAFVDCEKQFNKVIDEEDCSLFPRDCYPRDIANRTSAEELCSKVQEAACEYDFFCGHTFNLEACVTETAHIYECDQRLSAVPGGEACVTDLNRAACGDPLPESCADHTRF